MSMNLIKTIPCHTHTHRPTPCKHPLTEALSSQVILGCVNLAIKADHHK